MNTSVIIFWLCQNIRSFVLFFKLFILCRFCPIWRPYPQSSQVFSYDFSKSSSMFLQIYPGFCWSLCSSNAKGSICLLVEWADTASLCSSNTKGSICLLVKWADTAFWLARQKAYNRVQCWFNVVHVGWYFIHCLNENRRVNKVHLPSLVSRFHNKSTFIQCFNSGPASQTVAQYWTNIVNVAWTVETF